MDRSTRTALVVGIAVVVAALASFGVYQAIRKLPVREVEVRSVYQVVALKDLPTGTLITKDIVKVIPWPARSPLPGGFSTIDKVVNRGLLTNVVANEPITENKLAPIEAGGGLPPTITEGMRALSVRVNEVIGVAGFVVPGTHVDLLVTMKSQHGEEMMTRAVVNNLTVLTAGTRLDQGKSRDGQPIPTSVVTLLVTPQDAEKITLAQTQGQIMLTLRNPMDTKPTETNGIRAAAILGEPAPAPIVKNTEGRRFAVAAKPPPPPEPKIYRVEAIRAAKRSEEVVR